MKGRNLGEFEELVFLAVLGLGAAEATGAAVQERLRTRAKRRASLGAIYAALDRGHRKGLIESWVGEPTGEPGRRRRHYRVTSAGEAALRESRRARETLWRAAGEAAS